MRFAAGVMIEACTLLLLCQPAWPQDAASSVAQAQSAHGVPGPAMKNDRVEVWVVLSEPALATLPRAASGQREALLRKIIAQQNTVMASMRALGATESARTQQVENSIAVEISADSVKNIRLIQGVISVRHVSHKNKFHD